MAEAMTKETSKPNTDERNYYITAAIDFGTTFSCYAFSFNRGEHQGKVIHNKNWGGRLNTESLKNPTCVLTGPDHEFDSFGYEALSKYNDLSPEERKKYNMYSNYKQQLHTTQSFYGPAIIESLTGHTRDAMDIFVMGIKYLKDDMLKAIKGEAPHVTIDDIQWVLCTPAIWSAPAKQFVRRVVFKAGMIKELNSTQLMLSLEPEAAALFCRSVEMNHFTKGPPQLKMDSQDSPEFRFHTTTKFVLIDAGGGTVDITAYEILIDGNLKDIYPPSGGPWGGTQVDNCFITLLEDIFGKEFIAKYKRENSGNWLSLIIEFQKAKIGLNVEKETDIKIRISRSLDKAYESITGGDLETAIRDSGSGVRCEDDCLVIPFKVAKKLLFDPPVAKIIAHVGEMLKDGRLEELDYIMLVGGFGQCEILQHAVLDRFQHKAAVLLPLEAQVAVIRGAVKFGQNPHQVKSRIAMLTYGEHVREHFNKDVHDPAKKSVVEGNVQCKDCFRIFVHKDESVDVGEVRVFRANPIYSTQTEVVTELLSSTDVNPKYVDEESVNKVGETTLSIPDITKGRDRIVETRVSFGGTEILVEVRELNRDGSEIKKTIMDFLVQQ